MRKEAVLINGRLGPSLIFFVLFRSSLLMLYRYVCISCVIFVRGKQAYCDLQYVCVTVCEACMLVIVSDKCVY